MALYFCAVDELEEFHEDTDIGHTRCELSCIFFGFSRAQTEFLPHCLPAIHCYKLVLVVFIEFVVNGRIFLTFFYKV